MDISVKSGYSQQGSYTVSNSSQTGGDSPDTKVSGSGKTQDIDPVNAESADVNESKISSQQQTADQVADIISEKKDKEKLEKKQREQIKQAVSAINKHAHGTEAVFGIHEKTNRVTIKIVDCDTRKVIKEFPPEKTLDMIAKVWELAGILVDEKK